MLPHQCDKYYVGTFNMLPHQCDKYYLGTFPIIFIQTIRFPRLRSISHITTNKIVFLNLAKGDQIYHEGCVKMLYR